MGLTFIEGTVKGPSGITSKVKFLIDSGATYTLLPKSVCETIKLTPKREMKFILADGREIFRKVSECHIEITEGDGYTPVIIGEEGDEALLGVVTLEILGLVLNPFKRTLEPMNMMLA